MEIQQLQQVDRDDMQIEQDRIRDKLQSLDDEIQQHNTQIAEWENELPQLPEQSKALLTLSEEQETEFQKLSDLSEKLAVSQSFLVPLQACEK